jgi:hypothetical protein
LVWNLPPEKHCLQAFALDPKQETQIRLGVYARVTGCWATHDSAVVAALDEFHMYQPSPFLSSRLKWRPTQPITVLELRAYILPEPLVLDITPELFGCFSWGE